MSTYLLQCLNHIDLCLDIASVIASLQDDALSTHLIRYPCAHSVLSTLVKSEATTSLLLPRSLHVTRYDTVTAESDAGTGEAIYCNMLMIQSWYAHITDS